MSNETSDPSGSSTSTKSSDDGFIAAAILIVTVIVIAISAVFLWRNKNVFGITDNSWKTSNFTPPPERENYIAAKSKLNPSNPTHLDELKKLLMRRAIKAIPILLNLQNEGNSIERLYKRGMLTDDMHFKVKELKSFVDQEFQDVQVEAEDLVEGWGQHIWPQAMQFHQMIQKQADGKDVDEDETEDKVEAEEQKKTTTNAQSTHNVEKKKEKAKKSTPVVKDSQGTTAIVSEVVNDVEKKAQDAEKMAKMLLEEEERERSSGKKNNSTGSKVTPKK